MVRGRREREEAQHMGDAEGSINICDFQILGGERNFDFIKGEDIPVLSPLPASV